MRRIVVTEFVTLDGVMQAPARADEDREGGFPHGGWGSRAAVDNRLMSAIGVGMTKDPTFLFGRKTYESMLAHWPNQPDTDQFAAVLNPRPKYVVSRTLAEPLPWHNSHLISADVVGRIRALKSGDGGDISVLGSGELVQALLVNDLVDELSLFVYPLVLGTGKRLFRDGLPPTKLDLIEAIVGDTGAILMRYAPKEAD